MNDLSHYIDILPQQFPFRMIDEIVDYQEGKSLTAVKNITGNEWAFEGKGGRLDHFPETLIIEAAAQAALCYFHAGENAASRRPFLLGKVDVEFMEQVYIGDCITLKTDKHKKMERSGFMDVLCSKEGKKIASVQVFYGLPE